MTSKSDALRNMNIAMGASSGILFAAMAHFVYAATHSKDLATAAFLAGMGISLMIGIASSGIIRAVRNV